MLKVYLLPSLSLSSSFPREIASFHNRLGVCQRTTCNRAPMRKNLSTYKKCFPFFVLLYSKRHQYNIKTTKKKHVEKLPFLGRSDSRVQKQLYLQNGTGHPHQILNEHGKRVENAESGEISKNIFADLCLVFAWTVTIANWHWLTSTWGTRSHKEGRVSTPACYKYIYYCS